MARTQLIHIFKRDNQSQTDIKTDATLVDIKVVEWICGPCLQAINYDPYLNIQYKTNI